MSGRRPRACALAALLVAAGLVLVAAGASGVAGAEAGREIEPRQRKPGSAFLSPTVQTQQEDLAANPGMLWVEQGGRLWSEPAGRSRKACATCHGEAAGSMRGVAARYPAVDKATGRLMNLEARIIACRTSQQAAPAPAHESEDLLALTAFVAHQSRGLPISVRIDEAARPHLEAGRALYRQRIGQLNLSCAQCHVESWGRRLRSETISQGQATGYPIYRLEWQTLGSLYRRLLSCFRGVRAEPPRPGSDEHLALELYLAWRAGGLAVETPAMRR
ncbi:MAG: sulfur oxidation c-type cytochrome SoxA [Hyphomicrobiaceae bacterium]